MSNPTYEPNTPLSEVEAAKVQRFGLDEPDLGTMANEELIAEARKWPRELEGNLINDLADALAAVPAPAEADREALEEEMEEDIREAMLAEGMIETGYDDDDHVEMIPECHASDAIPGLAKNLVAWGYRRPTPAPKTQDGEAREALEEDIHEAMLAESMIETVYDDDDSFEIIARSYVSDVVPGLAKNLIAYGYRRLVPVSPEGGETK